MKFLIATQCIAGVDYTLYVWDQCVVTELRLLLCVQLMAQCIMLEQRG